MAETAIEWTATRLPDGTALPGYTFNPWEGCQKVGPGCDHCYAEARNVRFTGGANWGPNAPRRRTSVANWRKPIQWNAEAARSGIRRNVFCASLADVFDNHDSISDAMRSDLGALIAATPSLNWMLLTKRVGNAARYLAMMFPTGTPDNVWLGATVVNQAEADRDIPKLLAVPVAVRFLSMEPLLGPVDLTEVAIARPDLRASSIIDVLQGTGGLASDPKGRIDWIIVGGESGLHARPMHPDWARSLRDQCNAAGVPFFFKQWGEWVSALQIHGATAISSAPAAPGHSAHPDRRRIFGGKLDGQCFRGSPDQYDMVQAGKKDAGRLLDGRSWDEMPAD
jgi:protein gp37